MAPSSRTGQTPVLSFLSRLSCLACLSFLRVSLLVAAFATAVPSINALRAQIVRSWLTWRTIDTKHFAFHYPVELEAWTRHVALHADAIDSAVSALVGFTPAQRTNVVVDDPYESANGSAWPYLGRPIINLWASPAEPNEDIGQYRDWGEMLVSHEFGHIAHLTRPSRNALVRHIWESLPVRPRPDSGERAAVGHRRVRDVHRGARDRLRAAARKLAPRVPARVGARGATPALRAARRFRSI